MRVSYGCATQVNRPCFAPAAPNRDSLSAQVKITIPGWEFGGLAEESLYLPRA